MPTLTQINRKIKSIKITCKITEALKIVSANKFSVYRNLQKRAFPYLQGIYKLFFELYTNPDHEIKFTNEQLVKTDHTKYTLWVVIGTDIGMCSDFNHKIKNYLSSNFNSRFDGIFSMGIKLNALLIKDYPKNIEFSRSSEINISQASEEIEKISKELFKIFFTKNYSSLVFIYIKNLQESIIEKVNILPFTQNYFSNQKKINIQFLYTSLTFPSVIIDLFPKYLECLLLSGIIISKINEHTIRRDLMNSATKNANELLDDYMIAYNKLRQENITKELSEITVAVQTKKKK